MLRHTLLKTNTKSESVLRLAAVAGDASTCGSVLLALAAHPEPIVTLAVACNPYTPVEAMTILATSGDEMTRLEVARHLRTPNLLRRLGLDQNECVREAVAANDHTPRETLITMVQKDGSDGVVRLAKKTIERMDAKLAAAQSREPIIPM